MDINEIEKYSDSVSQRPQMPYYPLLKLDGNEGVFYLTTKKGDKKEKKALGDVVTLTIMKVRRQLSSFIDGYSTTEHNSIGDIVTVFWSNEVNGRYVTKKLDSGPANQMKEKYPSLSTQMTAYAIFNGEVVRLLVTGSSLGSADKPKDSIPFYTYLNQFKKPEHVWMYQTKLVPKEETNTKVRKKYFAISFEKGDKLMPEELNLVGENMKTLHHLFIEQDEYNSRSKANPLNDEIGKIEKQEHPSEEVPTVQLDDAFEKKDIKPEDLPF